MHFATFMDFAHMLADDAGEIARKYFRTDVVVETKADASPVSIADKEIEQRLRERIAAQFPEHGVLGEEFANDGAGRDYVWVVDPIDGTRAFLAGIPTFTTLIALCYQGVPILGIIDQPVVRERYSGLQGEASSLNGQPIHIRACDNLNSAVLGTTGMEYFSAEHKPRFEAVAAASLELRFGGDAYNYARLASGQLDLVIESGLKAYDAMALAPVVTGAGGVITAWDGTRLGLTNFSDVCVAGDARVHTQALALLA